MQDYSKDAVRSFYYSTKDNHKFVAHYQNKRLKTSIIALQPGGLPDPVIVTVRKGRMFVPPVTDVVTMFNNRRHLEFYYNIFYPGHDIEFVVFSHNNIIYKVPHAEFMLHAYCISSEMTVDKKLFIPIDQLREYII